MRISEICIDRPVFATVMSLAILLVGLVSFDRLSVRQYPETESPVVSVQTDYRGASADIVESQVTDPLEDALSSIEGIDYLESTSWPESSRVVITFDLERDIDSAASDVRDKVAGARGWLPDEIEEPVIRKQDADDWPIQWITFTSAERENLDLSYLVDQYVVDRLQTLSGVSRVFVSGDQIYAMRVWLDRARMAAYGVTPQDVEEALRSQNVELPSGRLESAAREFTILSDTRLATAAEFQKIVLKEENGYLVRLRDVARVVLGADEIRRLTRNNGVPGVGVGVIKQSNANPLDVAARVRDALVEAKAEMPQDITYTIAFDLSDFIGESISAVYTTILEAVLLVALVIFIFLRSLRATWIPLVTIPVSLIGAVAMIWAFGFSINTLTLLGLVLAIGLVVDDAIVMLENIQRHIEEGDPPRVAARKGAKEIGFAIIAMTLTLAAVYVPVSFATGSTGSLFIEFALTLAGAVVVSGFVALTLTPMMSSRILGHSRSGSLPISKKIETFMNDVTERYAAVLARVVRKRDVVAGALAGVVSIGLLAFWLLPAELIPDEDRGMIFTILRAPEGATLDYLSDYTKLVEAEYAKEPDVKNYFTSLGEPSVNQGRMFVHLNHWDDRDLSSKEIVNGLVPRLLSNPGILAIPVAPKGIGRSRGPSIDVKVLTHESYQDLKRIVDEVVDRARQNPSLIGVDTDLILNKPELRVDVDRAKVADAGTSVRAVNETLRTMLGGSKTTRFKLGGEEYDVIVQVADVDRRDPDDLTSIYVRGDNGDMLPLSSFVTVQESITPRYLAHWDKMRLASITAEPADGYSMGEALDYLENLIKEVGGEGVRVDYGGASREFKEASQTLYITFALALVFIYLVLSAQFESFRDPLVILLTVPLGIAGALLTLWIFGGSLNLFSQIGLVTLIGLISKHGILIVEFANQLQDRGVEKSEAVLQAARLRLRPILMTTGAMVLGAVPLAIASGAGAEPRHEIGYVIVGGLMFGTLFTLFVIPTAYGFLPARKRTETPVPAGAPQAAE